jgi:hypothetical protein
MLRRGISVFVYEKRAGQHRKGGGEVPLLTLRREVSEFVRASAVRMPAANQIKGSVRGNTKGTGAEAQATRRRIRNRRSRSNRSSRRDILGHTLRDIDPHDPNQQPPRCRHAPSLTLRSRGENRTEYPGETHGNTLLAVAQRYRSSRQCTGRGYRTHAYSTLYAVLPAVFRLSRDYGSSG